MYVYIYTYTLLHILTFCYICYVCKTYIDVYMLHIHYMYNMHI